MKTKIFLFALATTLAFATTACGSKSQAQKMIVAETTVVETTAELTTIESTTVEVTEQHTEKITQVTDNYVQLYTDENLSVYYAGTDSRASGNYILFWIENKSDKTYEILGDTITIDNVCYNDITCVGKITSNSSGEIDCNVTGWVKDEPSTIGLEMDYFVDNVDLDNMDRKHIQIENKNL